MLYLSQLLRFRAVDPTGRRLAICDVAIREPDEEDEPLIRALHLQDGLRVPCVRVKEYDLPGRLVSVHAADAFEPPENEVRLVRDVLDAQVLDLGNCRATRANDLVLELQGRELRLQAVDVGTGGVLRRLTRGWWKGRSDWYPWRDVEYLRGEPWNSRRTEGYQGRATRLPAGDLASLCQSVPYLHAVELIQMLPPLLAAQTLQILPPTLRLQVFQELSCERRWKMLANMASDRAADLVAEHTREEAQALLSELPEEPRLRILDLLRYPKASAGGIMTTDILTLSVQATVGQARQALAEKNPRFSYVVFLIQESSRALAGMIELRTLASQPDECPVAELIHPYRPTIRATRGAVSAAWQVVRSHLAAVPVVDDQGALVGAITADSALTQVLPTSLQSQSPRVFS